MVYESQIQFTLDTICPWTYLAKRRLERALSLVKSDAPAKFTVTYMPYQLYPEATQEGEDKYQWYKKSKYGDSQLKMDTYKKVMRAYGDTEGIKYKFGGTVANTLQAHRVVQHFQETKGPETANKIINSLYTQYFEEERHPSSHETLLRATTEAGIDESEAKAFIEDEDEGLMDIKMSIREQKGNGVDAVPYITFIGRKRDISLEGCREVKEYVDAIEKIIKESM
ncbi:thioredoxin-like protein [Acrodontium crateriforme]|uniref:Thioredoxin-like protein n=1 Tax=Acrodontium crateriforme TaxID=150365 RepID=A0AAQ3M995_9PEZI|nr:thioredoxin-like protein [Acrodontium crateriforme]